jgi:hypothetical protein
VAVGATVVSTVGMSSSFNLAHISFEVYFRKRQPTIFEILFQIYFKNAEMSMNAC